MPVVRFKELSRHADALAHATTAVVVERLVERSLILQLYTTGIFQRILLVPACHDLISLKSKVRRVGGMLSIELASDRPSPTAALGKRAFDVDRGARWRWSLLSPLLAGIALVGRASTARARSSSRSRAGRARAAPSRRSSSAPCMPTATGG